MDGVDPGRLIYLVILAVMILGWFLVQARFSLNKTLQQASIWALIFFGVIAAVGLWDDVSHTINPRQVSFADEGKIVVPRAPDGHYYIVLNVNDTAMRFVVDTGATDMVLTQDDAIAAGIDPKSLNYFGRAMTANGEVRTAPVHLETVTLGSITDYDMRAVVNDGVMAESLLGMEYLQHWGRIEITRGELILTR
ncbi:MAG: TIGR02281 family clan AA aspartic protease [Sulfitobacter sp.]